MSYFTRRTAFVSALICMILAIPTIAAAHTALVSSNPEDGATLDAMPTQIELTFTEDLSGPSHISVTAPDGELIAEGEAQIDGPKLIQPVPDPEQAGPYIVAYRAISADGHAIDGEYTFEVAEGEEVEPAAENVAAAAETEEEEGPPLSNPAILLMLAIPVVTLIALWFLIPHLRRKR